MHSERDDDPSQIERSVPMWSPRSDAKRPTLSEIAEFKPSGQRDDRLTLSVPHVVELALETLVSVVGRKASHNSAACWALGRGLNRIDALDDVRTICAARDAVLQSGSDAIEQLRWHHRVGHGSTKRLFLRYVAPSDQGKCARLGRGLGLEISALGALAVMAGLIDTPLPGNDVPMILVLELREFRRRVRQRAVLAEELRKRAVAITQSDRPPLSWDDIIEDDL